jgi:hypothetical protein
MTRALEEALEDVAMRWSRLSLALGVVACSMFCWEELRAQQATVSTPYHSVTDSYFENFGTSWGLRGKNWFFSFGGTPTQAAPGFGGFDPSAGANLGFGFRHGGVNGYFNANWAQGCRRSFVSQTPSVTVQNGLPGFVSDTSQSPFVIGQIPVVGGFPTVLNYSPVQPLPPNAIPGPGSSGVGRDAVLNALRAARARSSTSQPFLHATPAGVPAPNLVNPGIPPAVPNPTGPDQLILTGPGASGGATASASAGGAWGKLPAGQSSSAERPAPSVAEARRLHAAEQASESEEAKAWIERARHAESVGKPNVAKVYYRMAARSATGPLREQIQKRLTELGSDSESP